MFLVNRLTDCREENRTNEVAVTKGCGGNEGTVRHIRQFSNDDEKASTKVINILSTMASYCARNFIHRYRYYYTTKSTHFFFSLIMLAFLLYLRQLCDSWKKKSIRVFPGGAKIPLQAAPDRRISHS